MKTPHRPGIRRFLALGLCLFQLTLLGFWRVCFNDLVNYDDNKYITNNAHVLGGLTRDNLVWAWTTGHASNWHPLTWMSLQLDTQLFGPRPMGYHFTNLLLHASNAVLLFLALGWMTGESWRSFVVAALFAVHPLHVESVAWASERKDVLSTLFWMLTLLAYIAYARSPRWWRYLLVVLVFALGLLAKPMLVTLPFVLLLLDYWPLGRLDLAALRAGRLGLVWEKLPLFGLAAVSCLVTILVQRGGGAVHTLDDWSFTQRLTNALLAYVSYARKMFWPTDLAVLYPLSSDLSPWLGVGAGMLLVVVSLLMLWQARRLPYLLVGWLWFLGTLVPVIGLVQVGDQALADRYTYVPLIGLFLLSVWGLADLAARMHCPRAVEALGIAVVLCACLVSTWSQVRSWQDSISLWSHALRVTRNNPVAHNNLGYPLFSQGRLKEALPQFTLAVQLNPHYALAHNNLGLTYLRLGKEDRAVTSLEQAVNLEPGSAKYRYNLACALYETGRTDESTAQYREALRLDPSWPHLANQAAWSFMPVDNPQTRNVAEALELAKQACQATGFQQAEYVETLAAAYDMADRPDEAAATLRKALELSSVAQQPDVARRLQDRLREYEGRPAKPGPQKESGERRATTKGEPAP